MGQRAAMFCWVPTPLAHSIVAPAYLRPVPEQQLPVPQHGEDVVLGVVRLSCLQLAGASAA